jgi:2'-5' RNA ligase
VESQVLRLFFALPLPADVRAALGRWQRELPGVTGWSRPEGLHLTLAFLGSREAEALPGLEACAQEVAARHHPLALATSVLGGFPGGRAARILWLGLAPSPALTDLAADLRDALTNRGEAFDAKPFRPHLTLARFRQPRTLEGLAAPPTLPFMADHLALLESLAQGGYRAVRACPFREV